MRHAARFRKVANSQTCETLYGRRGTGGVAYDCVKDVSASLISAKFSPCVFIDKSKELGGRGEKY